MIKKILISLFLVFSFYFSYSQAKYVLPGNSLEVKAETDTMWILTDPMIRKVLKVDMENDVLEEQVFTLQQQVELLKLQGEKKDTLILILEEDRDYYKKIWETCSQDVDKLGEISKKSTGNTRIAIVAGVVTTIIAFIVGAFVI